ncbi:MAG: hypothetical protein FGM46_10585, partial [Ferruginibacter sp.]|nr:hypothetical protein [Ferruginibacter sp.]
MLSKVFQLILFSFLSISLYAQEKKCCMYIGTYETEKSNCGNSRAFEAIPIDRKESLDVDRKFYHAHENNWPEGTFLYENEIAIVFEYSLKNCTAKGVSWIIAEDMPACQGELQSRINQGRYNEPVNVVYR